MKVLCLIDSVVKPGDRWLWDYLPANDDEVDFVFTTADDRFAKWGKLFGYYPTFWRLAFQAWRKTQHSHYDLVVAWEGKNGFPYAVLRQLLGQRTPPLVILSFSYRGMLRHVPLLARWALRAANLVTVTTQFEREAYAQQLGLGNRVALCLLGCYDTATPSMPQAVSDEKFILAPGRSYRDYGILAQAVDGLDIKTVIIARPFNLAGIDLPANVETKAWLTPPDFNAMLHLAQFVVVPLLPVPHASGDTVLLQAMSAGQAVIATRAPGPETYVEHGVTGLLVPPGDVAALREAILYLWHNPTEAARMGREAQRRYRAQYTFAAFAQRIYSHLRAVYQAQLPVPDQAELTFKGMS